MAKLNRVKAARKDVGACGKCGQPITAGQPYVWWKFMVGGRGGRKLVRHAMVLCLPKPWEYVTQSPKRQTLMQAEDALDNARMSDTLEEAAGYVRQATELVRSVAEDMESTLDAWSGTGLENTSRAEEWDQAKDDMYEWADDAEQAADDLENQGEPELDPEEDEDNLGEVVADVIQEALDQLDDIPEYPG